MKKQIIFLLTVALMLAMLTGCDSADYKKAMELYESGSYLEAAAMFEELGDYEDSEEQALNCKYDYAAELFDNGKYLEAADAFAELDGYKDSDDQITECKYLNAEALYQAGSYEEAIAAYESIPGYKDADEKLAEAKLQQMYITYESVFAALDGGTWFYESTSVNEVKKVTFTKETADLGYIYYDGNGSHYSSPSAYPYTVDDSVITIASPNGEMVIPYTMEGDQIVLEGAYFTPEQVDAALQGFWGLEAVSYNAFTGFVFSEYIFCYENGSVTYENATAAYDGNGYYYYGPYSGTYTVNENGLVVDARNNWQFGFVISEGQVAMYRCDSICVRYTGFKGENGYSF